MHVVSPEHIERQWADTRHTHAHTLHTHAHAQGRAHSRSAAHPLACTRTRGAPAHARRVCVQLNMLSTLNVLHVGCAGFNKVLGPYRPQSAYHLPPGNPSLHALTRCQLSPCVRSSGSECATSAPVLSLRLLRQVTLCHVLPRTACAPPSSLPLRHSYMHRPSTPLWAQSQCRCGRSESSPGADAVRVERGTGADVAGVSPVPALIR